MDKLKEELYQLWKNDPELEEVFQTVQQIQRVYADIREVRGLDNKSIPLVVSNSAKESILFRSDSAS